MDILCRLQLKSQESAVLPVCAVVSMLGELLFIG